MPTLTDTRFEALRSLGYTGATSDMLFQWLKENGATLNAATVPDAWRDFLIARLVGEDPANYHRNDWLFQYLGELGLTGNLNDREMAFWTAIANDGGAFGEGFDEGFE